MKLFKIFGEDGDKKDVEALKKIEEEPEKQVIIESFCHYVKENNIVPTFRTLRKEYKLPPIGKYFLSIDELLVEAGKVDEDVKNHFFSEHDFKSSKVIAEEIKKCKRLIITTAVNNKKVDKNFLNSLKNYAKTNKAKILILPCEDISRRKSQYEWHLDPSLKGLPVVYKDIFLNDNIYISEMKVSAKQINPLTGLDRFTQKGSVVLASPKQYLKYIPNSNTKLPRALMTTGAVTVPDYVNDYYMSKRTSKIAEFDHVCGAIVVEIEDSERFHFRQLQAGLKGEIVDLGVQYNADGTKNIIKGTVAVLGDSHVGAHDKDILEEAKNVLTFCNCKEAILHDIFDAQSISHHDANKPLIKAKRAYLGCDTLLEEGQLVASYLEDLSTTVGKLIVVKSNHDEALDRYLNEGRFIKDKQNLYLSLSLAKAVMDGYDPLKYLLEEEVGFSKKMNIKWLERDEDYKVYGVECSCHFDVGANGAKSSDRTMENAYGKATGGHRHSAGIFRQIYTVGTFSMLQLLYNKGASSWTHTMCLHYPNGTRQLINLIKDESGKVKWRIK